MTEQADTNPEPTAPPRRSLAELLLPDRLKPPPWDGFAGRWTLLLILCTLWLVTLKTPALWPEDKLATNLIYSALALVLLSVGISIYGMRRLRGDLAIRDIGSIAWHVLILTVAWGLAGHFLAAEPQAGGAATVVRVDKALVLSAILAKGFLGPLAEEFALRFVFFRVMRLRIRFSLAALACAVVFGALHFTNHEDPLPIVRGVLMGLLSCWAFERTSSILTPAVAHIVTNLLSDMH